MVKIKPLVAAICLGMSAAFIPAGASAAEQPTLVVANWNDYIDENLIQEFTIETGIKVDYRTYESDEALWGYADSGEVDVITPSMPIMQSLIRAGKIQSFDTQRMEGVKDLQSIIRARLRSRDALSAHGVPYLWGRIGMLVNVEKVEQALGEPVPNSWSLLFDKDKLEKLASCGVTVLDGPLDSLSLYTNYAGRTLDNMSERKVDYWRQHMLSIAPYFKAIDSAAYIDEMPAGTLCVAMAWEGDGKALSAQNSNLKFILPEEGVLLFMDNMAIPTRAPNKELAEKYIEFMSRPDSSRRIAEYTGYNSPSKTALQQMAEVNPAAKINLSDVTFFMPPTLLPEMTAAINNDWVQLVADVASGKLRNDKPVAAAALVKN